MLEINFEISEIPRNLWEFSFFISSSQASPYYEDPAHGYRAEAQGQRGERPSSGGSPRAGEWNRAAAADAYWYDEAHRHYDAYAGF